ncbi:MAG: UPF0149 family protein [Rhodoferax sp.]
MPHHDATPSPASPDLPGDGAPAAPQYLEEIDAILDDLRLRFEETPEWEFCEGFMAALICCRRPIGVDEYLEVLLDIAPEGADDTQGRGAFADAAQRARFLVLWQRRWDELATALDSPIESLQDEAAYLPAVTDVRGAVAALSEVERAELDGQPLPSFAQIWAVGFMYAVESWPEEWQAPRDKQAARWLDSALQAIVGLTEDDTDEPVQAPLDPADAPSASSARLNAFADAIWAVYDLRELWRSIGPRVAPLQRADTPARNDPCSCGSGKKYKKCCGA